MEMGQKVYVIDERGVIENTVIALQNHEEEQIVALSGSSSWYSKSDIGRSLFLTREEAEAAYANITDYEDWRSGQDNEIEFQTSNRLKTSIQFLRRNRRQRDAADLQDFEYVFKQWVTENKKHFDGSDPDAWGLLAEGCTVVECNRFSAFMERVYGSGNDYECSSNFLHPILWSKGILWNDKEDRAFMDRTLAGEKVMSVKLWIEV